MTLTQIDSLKVFLSSTALDVGAYREVDDDTLARRSQQTAAIEGFGTTEGRGNDRVHGLSPAGQGSE
jgi:hypothetical protein